MSFGDRVVKESNMEENIEQIEEEEENENPEIMREWERNYWKDVCPSGRL